MEKYNGAFDISRSVRNVSGFTLLHDIKSFVTAPQFSLRNNLICKQCTNWAIFITSRTEILVLRRGHEGHKVNRNYFLNIYIPRHIRQTEYVSIIIIASKGLPK